jgi:hypothetical protein
MIREYKEVKIPNVDCVSRIFKLMSIGYHQILELTSKDFIFSKQGKVKAKATVEKVAEEKDLNDIIYYKKVYKKEGTIILIFQKRWRKYNGKI